MTSGFNTVLINSTSSLIDYPILSCQIKSHNPQIHKLRLILFSPALLSTCFHFIFSLTDLFITVTNSRPVVSQRFVRPHTVVTWFPPNTYQHRVSKGPLHAAGSHWYHVNVPYGLNIAKLIEDEQFFNAHMCSWHGSYIFPQNSSTLPHWRNWRKTNKQEKPLHMLWECL